jgi:hypothetical protein
MNTTLTPPQIRLVALLGMLVVVMGGAMLVLGRDKTSSPTPAPAPAHHSTSGAPAATTPSTTKPQAKPATKPHAVPAKPARLATHGLPVAVAQALQHNRVVVVSLVTPGADVDRLAHDEAAAAAKSSHTGFVPLNVLSQADGVPLLKKLGLIEAPAVLVVLRPGRIFAQFEGYADRQTVEQAVADARR